MQAKTFFLIVLLCLSFGPPAVAADKVRVIIEGLETKGLKTIKKNAEAKENILTTLSLETQKENPRLTDSAIRKLHEKAPGEIKIALQALGYYKPTITSNLSFVEGIWLAHYKIDPGEPLRVKNMSIKISGDAIDDLEFNQLRQSLSLKKGDILHHGKYEATKKELQRLAASRGYFDAELTKHSVEVDLLAYSANVTISFNTGKRYSFGDIEFLNSPIQLDKIEQYLKFKSGDPFSNSQLVELQQDLFNSDYFEAIDVRPLREKAQNHIVPIEVHLIPKKQDLYTGGAGFGTDTGPRLKLGWNHRFTSLGHRLGTDARISPRLSSLTAYYNIAHLREKNDQLGFNTIISSEDTDTSKSDSINFGSNYRHKRWGWDETISLNYLYENFEISNVEETSQLLIPGIGWSILKSDSEIYTKNGYRLGFSIRGGSDSVLSDTSFIQASLSGKYIRSLGQKGRFLTRADIGITEVSDFARLPSTLRYYAGGDRSIRGFDYEDLGPTDDDGNTIGGRYLMVGSLEYEHRIKEKWAIAAFVDAGNSFNDFGDDLEYGTGFGVRWLSPVGQVRIDLAMGVSSPDKPIRLHIVIGPDL